MITACPPEQVGSPVDGACAGKSNKCWKNNHEFLLTRAQILSTILILLNSEEVINKILVVY